jgi:hypothetical protein
LRACAAISTPLLSAYWRLRNHCSKHHSGLKGGPTVVRRACHPEYSALTYTPDLLVDFTKVFREYGLKMEQLETKTVCDSSLGTDSEYIMEGELTAQDSVDVGSLEADLNKLGRLHNVSVELDHFVEFGCSLER